MGEVWARRPGRGYGVSCRWERGRAVGNRNPVEAAHVKRRWRAARVSASPWRTVPGSSVLPHSAERHNIGRRHPDAGLTPR